MLEALTQYYGLDWAGMLFGMTGLYFITQQNRVGFLFNIISCICGFSIAAMSNQYGFIFYNAIFVFMMMRAYNKWPPKAQGFVAVGAE